MTKEKLIRTVREISMDAEEFEDGKYLNFINKKFLDLDLFLKQGFFKLGDITYVLEEHEYPHDEHCSGTMCWCAAKAKRDNPEKWKKYEEKNPDEANPC